MPTGRCQRGACGVSGLYRFSTASWPVRHRIVRLPFSEGPTGESAPGGRRSIGPRPWSPVGLAHSLSGSARSPPRCPGPLAGQVARCARQGGSGREMPSGHRPRSGGSEDRHRPRSGQRRGHEFGCARPRFGDLGELNRPPGDSRASLVAGRLGLLCAARTRSKMRRHRILAQGNVRVVDSEHGRLCSLEGDALEREQIVIWLQVVRIDTVEGTTAILEPVGTTSTRTPWRGRGRW